MIRKFIAQNIGMRLSDIFDNKNVLNYYSEFKKTLDYTGEQIKEYQFKKLKLIIEHAYKNTIFYKQQFDSLGLKPDNIKSFDDLSQIPVLTREKLQNNWEKIIANGYNKKQLQKGSSSGSTGEPVTYFKDKNGSSAGVAALLIGWGLSGWEFGLKGLHIWGNPTIVKKEWKRLSSKIKVYFFNHYKYPSYKLTNEKNFAEIVSLINDKQFDFIDGYTNALYLLADYIKKNNISIYKPKFVFPTGENLQLYQKKILSEVFGDIFDSYGCGEINGIAYQCKLCGKYHVIDPHVFVEYGDNMTDYGARKLIITDLDNWGFPLIRYENEDTAIPLLEKDNNCKIKYSRIEAIEGRVSDLIKLQNGGILSVPSFFGSMLLKDIQGVKQYQIELISDDFLNIKIVSNEYFHDKELVLINKFLKNYIGEILDWKISIVDNINVSNTGKYKLLIDKRK